MKRKYTKKSRKHFRKKSRKHFRKNKMKKTTKKFRKMKGGGLFGKTKNAKDKCQEARELVNKVCKQEAAATGTAKKQVKFEEMVVEKSEVESEAEKKRKDEILSSFDDYGTMEDLLNAAHRGELESLSGYGPFKYRVGDKLYRVRDPNYKLSFYSDNNTPEGKLEITELDF